MGEGFTDQCFACPTLCFIRNPLFVRAMQFETHVTNLFCRVQGFNDCQYAGKIVDETNFDGSRVDNPIEIQDTDHYTHHQDIGQGPLSQCRKPCQGFTSAAFVFCEEPGHIEHQELQMGPNSRKYNEQNGGRTRQKRPWQFFRRPQLLDGKHVCKCLDILLFVNAEWNVIVQSQYVKGSACLVFGGIRPNVNFCIYMEFPHGVCLAIVKDNLACNTQQGDQKLGQCWYGFRSRKGRIFSRQWRWRGRCLGRLVVDVVLDCGCCCVGGSGGS
mmetsp:Transcript_6639/g.13711  ORF Transcript_6639/g.13711 Transcript_6639/m.13711 type:complete len:271 (-) Transcript_6639:117-929(-)